MSILIKGMDMPKNCKECDFCNEINFEGYLWFDYYCSVKDKSFDWDDDDNKPDWCPLVEIPTPHGRLIDADKLNIYDVSPASIEGYGFCVMGVTEEDIELADTVIEAEGETDGR